MGRPGDRNYLGLAGADSASEPPLSRAGGVAGLFAALVGLLVAALFTWFGVLPYLDLVPPGVGFVDGPGLGASNAPVLAFWSGVVAVAAVLVGASARTRRPLAAWVLALGLLGLTYLGMFSIGPLVAPFALLTVVAAALLTGGWLQRRRDEPGRDSGSDDADPPASA